ncbi:hypothetical protein J6358_20015 [Burkholderia pseudomallei]|uniref:hypothetical protein n=1 Tax=Burkholderia pseudomallei TaxID=28450 RepID=UPI00193E0706|nr:hypothetical protein [Burkholderia pseudomallei]MBO7752772.1 hypothetical protein [Burkholderia pseudomallei]MBO7804340.1 hypothetical protein [Burkholderia pseudomallei]MBO7932023.1 hypothetical protein [Burkholderia pseudomallei]QRM22883.1 hypothetical protein JQX71_00605 [Burkholderia pseudomallei]
MNAELDDSNFLARVPDEEVQRTLAENNEKVDDECEGVIQEKHRQHHARHVHGAKIAGALRFV